MEPKAYKLVAPSDKFGVFLVGRRALHVIDDDHVDHSAGLFEPQPELFLKGREDRRRHGLVGRVARPLSVHSYEPERPV